MNSHVNILRILCFLSSLAAHGGKVAGLECYSCLHQEDGLNLLSVQKDVDLQGEVYTLYKAFFDSVTNSNSTIKSSLDLLTDRGQHCVNDPTKLHTCQTYEGAGNEQHCGTVFIMSKRGGKAWARGCIAEGICQQSSNKTITSGNSRLELDCCSYNGLDPERCNNADLSVSDNSGSTAVHRNVLVALFVLCFWIAM